MAVKVGFTLTQFGTGDYKIVEGKDVNITTGYAALTTLEDADIFLVDDNAAGTQASTKYISASNMRTYFQTNVLATTVTVSDSTANTNFPVVFHNESNALLDDTATLTYNPSTETLTVPNLSVSGTTTTVNTTTLTVEDKNVELGKVGSPTDSTADGGGITLKGDTDKTFNWVNASDAWTSSEHIKLATGKNFLIDTGKIGYSDGSISNAEGFTFTAPDGEQAYIELIKDAGDSNGDFWAIHNDGNLKLESKISGSYQSFFTITPNATPANSQITIPGKIISNDGVSGSFILSGPNTDNHVTLEMYGDANVEKWKMLDTHTTGLFAFQNYANNAWQTMMSITPHATPASSQIDMPGSLNVVGDVDVDGTLEADAITVNGATLASVIEGTTVTNATNASTVTITDNENTNEINAIVFTSNGALEGGNLGLESDGTLNYNPSSGILVATAFQGALVGNATTATAAGTVTAGTQANITTCANLTTVGTIGTGVWEGTDIGIEHGGTGASNSDDWLNSRITTNVDGTLNYDATSATAPNHDSLAGFVANEHIDWTTDQGGTNIHSGNYTNTTYSVMDTNNSYAAGLVPAGSGTHGDTYLRKDGTWSTPINTDTDTQLTTEQVQDIVGAMFSGNTETRIAAVYQDSDGTIDLTVEDMTANTMGSGFTVAATTNTNPSTITQGDTLTIAAGTGISTTATADGTITIANTGSTITNYITNDADDTMVGKFVVSNESFDPGTSLSQFLTRLNDTSVNATTNVVCNISGEINAAKGNNQSTTTTGLNVAIDTANNTHNSTATYITNYGAKIGMTANDSASLTIQYGLHIDVAGGDATASHGIYVDNLNGGKDIKLVSSVDSGDYAAISTTTHGATTIETVDDNATAAHLTLDIDGDIELNADGGDIVFKDDTAPLATINSDGLTIRYDGSSHAVLNSVNGAGDFTISTVGNILGTGITNEFTLKNGTGGVAHDQYAIFGNGAESMTLTSKGAYDIRLNTNSGTNSGFLHIEDGANGLITLQPNGTGTLLLGVNGGTIQFATNSFLDANGNAFLGYTAESGAVNELLIGNSATGNAVTLASTGTDANVPLTVSTKGTGNMTLDGGGDIELNADGGNITFKDDTTDLLTIQTDEVKSESPFKVKESAAAVSDTAAYGQIWIKNSAPNELAFTDDAGTDIIGVGKYMYDIQKVGYNSSSALASYLPMNGYIIEGTSQTGRNEYQAFVAPYNGTIEKIMWRSEVAQDGTFRNLIWESTNGTEVPGTIHGRWDVVVDVAANNTVEFDYTATPSSGTNVLTKGRIYSISIDPVSAPGDTNATVVLKWDITS